MCCVYLVHTNQVDFINKVKKIKKKNIHNGQLKINIKKDVQVTKNNHDHPAMLGPVE